MKTNLDEIVPPEKPTFWTRVEKYFFTGLIAGLPFILTLYLVYLFDQLLRNFWPEPFRGKIYMSLVSLIIIILIILAFGWLTSHLVGRRLMRVVERVLKEIPLISNIFGTMKQVTDAFNTGKSAFREVVMVRFPDANTWAVAFKTADAPEMLEEATGRKLIGVFVPTTPNPTSGYLLYYEESEIIKTNMTVDQAFKLVISAGMITKEATGTSERLPAVGAEASNQSKESIR
ncbi:MAG: DUF502 domain-containing protein [Candidatus Brocadiia bacterium]